MSLAAPSHITRRGLRFAPVLRPGAGREWGQGPKVEGASERAPPPLGFFGRFETGERVLRASLQEPPPLLGRQPPRTSPKRRSRKFARRWSLHSRLGPYSHHLGGIGSAQDAKGYPRSAYRYQHSACGHRRGDGLGPIVSAYTSPKMYIKTGANAHSAPAHLGRIPERQTATPKSTLPTNASTMDTTTVDPCRVLARLVGSSSISSSMPARTICPSKGAEKVETPAQVRNSE